MRCDFLSVSAAKSVSRLDAQTERERFDCGARAVEHVAVADHPRGILSEKGGSVASKPGLHLDLAVRSRHDRVAQDATCGIVSMRRAPAPESNHAIDHSDSQYDILNSDGSTGVLVRRVTG